MPFPRQLQRSGHVALLAFGAACSDGSSVADAPEVRELVARSRELPRPELDAPESYYGFESQIAFEDGGTLAFEWEDGLPLVAGRVNGVPVRLVADTAAYGPMLYLDWVAARACGAYVPSFEREATRPEAQGGSGWSVPGFVDHASFGDLLLPVGGRIEIIEPLPYAVFGERNVPPERRGLVGIGQLTTHLLFAPMSTWDLSAGSIRLQRESDAPELPPGARRLASRWEVGAKRVWLTVETRARTLELLLDSGSQLTILPRDALPDDVELDEREQFLTASGEESRATALRKARLDLLRLGDFELRDFEIAVTPGDVGGPEPTLSASDLREYGIVFLPRSQGVFLFVPER